MLRGSELCQAAVLPSAEIDTVGAAASTTAPQSRSWNAFMESLTAILELEIGFLNLFL
jgi:hypothetical protein